MDRLDGVDGRKSVAGRKPSDVGVAVGVHGDSLAAVVVGGAQERRIDKLGARGVELGDVGFVAGHRRGLKRPGERKIGRSRISCDVGHSAAVDGNDFIIYDFATGALFYDIDGNGPTGQVQFAQLPAALALSSKDFLVV